METEKDLTNTKDENKQKIQEAVNELIDFFTQIWAINNTLRLLYSLLEGEERGIAEPSSAIAVCMMQLDYIYNHSSEVLDIILDCSGIPKHFGY